MGYKKKIHNKECDVCRKKFSSHTLQAKYCSRECRAIRSNEYYKRQTFTKLPSGTVGALAELLVSHDLLNKGYSVFRSLSPSCYCDLIAVKNGKAWEIEVRTGYMSRTKKLAFPKLKRGTVNCFAVYERNTTNIYYFTPELEKIEM